MRAEVEPSTVVVDSQGVALGMDWERLFGSHLCYRGLGSVQGASQDQGTEWSETEGSPCEGSGHQCQRQESLQAGLELEPDHACTSGY